MQDELLNLQEIMDKTVIFITHDFLEAVKLGDKIAITKDGEIVQIGTSDQLIINPTNEYVREFTKDVPRSRVLSARAVMQPCEVIVFENDSLQVALAQLRRRMSNIAFVKAANGRFLGLISLEQVDRAVQSHQPTVRAAMENHQPTVQPGTALRDLITLVAVSDAPVPVVDPDHFLLGALDRTSVMRALGNVDAVPAT